MKTYSNETIKRVNKVVSDFGGNKEKALNHFEKYAKVNVFDFFGFDNDRNDDYECAEYLKTIM